MKVAVITGGVGGAKFVHGLQSCEELEITAIVNTGDDFRHLGLCISPDIDTLLYTLSGKSDRERGWGRADESWDFMEAMRELGGPDWFNLGDRDLALHIWRTAQLAEGMSLTEVTAQIARRFGIGMAVLPMSDEAVATWLETDEGPLAFQDYFVRRQCEPRVHAMRFEGAECARPAPSVLEALARAEAIFIAPSNPWLSVDPVLAVPEIREALADSRVPVVSISPLVGGKAVKGPTSKLIDELGLEPSNATIAAHYGRAISAMLHDPADAPPPIAARAEPTLMIDDTSRARVAAAAVAFARELA